MSFLSEIKVSVFLTICRLYLQFPTVLAGPSRCVFWPVFVEFLNGSIVTNNITQLRYISGDFNTIFAREEILHDCAAASGAFAKKDSRFMAVAIDHLETLQACATQALESPEVRNRLLQVAPLRTEHFQHGMDRGAGRDPI
jgi:hypothetical protein